MVAGHPEIVRRAIALLKLPIEVQSIDDPANAEPSPTKLPCLNVLTQDAVDTPPGHVDARGGQAAYDALVAVTDLALVGQVDAIVTAPLHKEALAAAGHNYPGHTELLAARCGVERFAMMLFLASGGRVLGPAGLGVAHVTLHMALRDVFAHLDIDAIVSAARLLADMMQRLGARPARLGVAALNPHASDGGLFGDEEARIIAPAVERGRSSGLHLTGPLPADTLLVRAAAGEFDGVVAMYHDQGHIALKLLGWKRAVNVTLGLPIVRTSVAHGTAFDIAWRGVADPSSMVEAVRVAGQLARTRDSTESRPIIQARSASE